MKKQDNQIEIVGVSEHVKYLHEQINHAANNDRTVLIQGPTGTGKDLVANNIHFKSGRGERAFEILNCGAIPSELFESELFGHEKGAYTGATARRDGKAKLADGGTLFLDEIGDLRSDHQVKILRFLDDKNFTPVGGGNKNVDVRIIAATNKKLTDEVSSDRFRNDLYQRLNQLYIATDPLSDRPEDVICIVNHFAKVKNIKDDKKSRFLTKIKFLLYSTPDFPGNVRQLQSLILKNLNNVIQELEDDLDSMGNRAQPPKRPRKMGELKADDIADLGRKSNKYKEQQRQWHNLEHKTKALRTALYFVKENDPGIDFEKCVKAYEIITLFQHTKLSKENITEKLRIQNQKLSPSIFKKEFGFDFPDRNNPYNVLSPIDIYPAPKKSNYDEDYED